MKIFYIVLFPLTLLLVGGFLGVFLWKMQYKPITPTEAIERITGENKKESPLKKEEKEKIGYIYPCDMAKTQSVCTMEFDPYKCNLILGEEHYEIKGTNLCKAKLQMLQQLCKNHPQIQEKDYQLLKCQKNAE